MNFAVILTRSSEIQSAGISFTPLAISESGARLVFRDYSKEWESSTFLIRFLDNLTKEGTPFS